MVVKFKWINIFLIDFVLLVIVGTRESLFLITAIFIVWSNLVVYSLENIKTRCVLFVFLISFFTFLIIQQIIEDYGFYDVPNQFGNIIDNHAKYSLLISLIFLAIGFQFKFKFSPTRRKIHKPIVDNNTPDYYHEIRRVSITLFFLTYAMALYYKMDVASFVSENGYLEYYVSYTSRVPFILRKIGDISSIAFWVYMASMPSKKESKIPIIFYIIYLIVTLGTGKRFEFVAGLLSLFVYFILRNDKQKREIWFNWKYAIVYVVAFPFLIALLSTVQAVRVGIDPSSIDYLKGVVDFFYEQGGTINIIKYEKQYEYMLQNSKIYMLGTTIDLLEGNVIARLLNVTHYTGQTVEHALYGNILSARLTYIVMPQAYLIGRGMGSCYIAEAYHDFGYVGIAVVNLLYGIILRKFSDFKKHDLWKTAIVFLLIRPLLLAPRGGADAFLSYILNATTWGTLLIIYVLSKARYNYKLKHQH